MNDLQPHIKLKSVDKICLLSGNPDRVPTIASHLKDVMQVADHRGLIAFKGVTPNNNIPVTILTTGMGTGSSSIVLEEAYRAGGRVFIRIGSTGSFHQNDGIGSIFIPHAAIRDEGTSRQLMPIEVPAVATPWLHQALCEAAETMDLGYKTGLVWTTDIYYYPSGVERHKKWKKYGATCVEMESAALFSFAVLKGSDVSVATILTADGNLDEEDSIYVGDVDINKEVFQNGVHNTIKCIIRMIDSRKWEAPI
jgi:uridine phosphorylase